MRRYRCCRAREHTRACPFYSGTAEEIEAGDRREIATLVLVTALFILWIFSEAR